MYLFMTVDNLELLHYDVFIGTGGIEEVFINDVLQDPMPSGLSGAVGFGTSPAEPLIPHVIAEFQIGLETAGFDDSVCCYSPDPAFWSSGLPPGECPDPNNPNNPNCPPPNGECPNANNPNDCDGDGVPNDRDKCPEQPGRPENNGCPPPSGDSAVGVPAIATRLAQEARPDEDTTVSA